MTPAASDPLPPRIVRRRHPGRWAAGLALVALLAFVVSAFAESKGIEWPVVGAYLFEATILQGLGVTIWLTVAAQVGATIVGILIAAMRQSRNTALAVFARGYIWLFRGVPLLVQLIFIYNLALIFPRLGIGVPYTPFWWAGDTNRLIDGTTAAIIGFSLADGAAMSEIVRAGILSVPEGQREASAAFGLSPGQAMRRVILPQAMPFIIPPTGNNFIQLLKGTALVSVIAGHDLLTNAEAISGRTYQTVELLLVASFWYLVLVSVATVGQHALERHFARSRRQLRGGP